MTDQDFVYEGTKGIYLTSRAEIIDDQQAMEIAWAEKHAYVNPNYSWILGKYVEADRANSNRQRFTFEDLKANKGSLTNAALNINHSQLIVGTVAASEIVFPTAEEADGQDAHPYVEALSIYWKTRFPKQFEKVEKAHHEGTLFYSMETRPEKINCGDCGETFEYVRRQDPSYCEHLNDMTATSDKNLINPDFRGSALIVPPTRPGWKFAAVSEISEFIEGALREEEQAFEAVKSAHDLSTKAAEDLMRQLIAMDRLARL